MPYHVGEKGSNGCSGYPVVSVDGKVMGCHGTEAEATSQVQALYANEPGLKKEYQGCGCPTCKELNVDCENCPVCGPQSNQTESNMDKAMEYMSCNPGSTKCDNPDCLMCAMKDEDMVKSIDCCLEDLEKGAPCWDGYVQRGMKPGDNGKMVPNCVPVEKAEDFWEDDDSVVYETDLISKADTYSPPAGARAAARKAIRFKEQGKANGAGTSVGWTRAGQLARGEALSLSTVKRMYSYFSRHEVDKKGKDWANQSNPSNGYIMWLAWGGDAGFAWSRRIVAKETDKFIFNNFGKDVSGPVSLKQVFINKN